MSSNQSSIPIPTDHTHQLLQQANVLLGTVATLSQHLAGATISETGWTNNYPDKAVGNLASVHSSALHRLQKVLDDDSLWVFDKVGITEARRFVTNQADYWAEQKKIQKESQRPYRQLGAIPVRGVGEFLTYFNNGHIQIVGKGATLEASRTDFDAKASEAISEAQREQERQQIAAAQQTKPSTPSRKGRVAKKGKKTK